MSGTLNVSQAEVELQQESADDRIRQQVWGLLASMDPRAPRSTRRRDSRYPHPYLVYLSPVRGAQNVPYAEPVVVVGKYLSERGLTFYHPAPVPFRRVIATLESANGVRVGFLMDVTWCRFTRQGWYESGGRFLEVVPSPISV